MIKLFKILSEIKIESNKYPSDIILLYFRLNNELEYLYDSGDNEKYDELSNNLEKTINKYGISYIDNFNLKVRELSQNNLNRLYFELKEFEHKYNIQEIKIIPNITPEIVWKEYEKVEKIIHQLMDSQDAEKLRIIKKLINQVLDDFWFLNGEEIESIIYRSSQRDLQNMHKILKYVINNF